MLSALVWNLLLTTALAVVLAGLCRLPSLRRRPALKHWLWLLLLAKLVTPSLIAMPLLPAAIGPKGEAPTALPLGEPLGPQAPVLELRRPTNPAGEEAAAMAPAPVADRAGSQALGGDSHTTLLGGLLAVSLAGTCVLLTVQAGAAVRLFRRLRRAATENDLLSEACDQVASSLKIRRVVRSCVVDVRTTPLLCAWREPMVVVPRQLLDELSPQQLRSIIAHELAHLVRHDHWANAFVLVVKSLMWWNPVVWWADRELRAAQELCCDALAIEHGDADRRSYATTLLKALDFIQVEPLAPRALAAGMGSRATILRRFEMIGETHLSYRLSRGAFLMLLVLMVPLICIPVRAQEQPAAPAAAKTEGKTEGTAKDEPAKAEPVEKIKVVKTPTETIVGERSRGNCSISGKVVSEATGEPVANARMFLTYSQPFGAISVSAAGDGTFEFKDIAKGTYTLQSQNTRGYQDAGYDPEGKSGRFAQFSLTEGEHRTGIVIKVKQAYRISGKILDEQGKIPEHVDDLVVWAWSKQDNSDEYKEEQGWTLHADGTYHIDGLSGKPIYLVASDWRAVKEGRDGDVWPPIYYPSAFSRSDAKLITFDETRSIENADITVRKKGGILLEGTVHDNAGKPIPEAFVVVHPRDMFTDLATTYTDEQGHYEFPSLGDGEFLVHVDAAHRGFVRTRTPVDLDKASKTARRDFTLNQGVAISGKFVDEKGQDWQIGTSFGRAMIAGRGSMYRSITLTGFRARFGPQDVGIASAAGYFALGEGDYEEGMMIFPTKSTFLIQGMRPGHTLLAFSPGKDSQKAVKILYDGREIKPLDDQGGSGIDTKAGQEIKDVTIVVGTQEPLPPGKHEEKDLEARTETVVGVRPQGNCSISGKVVLETTGEPINNARMYLHYNVTHGSIFINTAKDGTFTFKDIPKGPFSLQSSHTAGYHDVPYDPDGKSGQFPQFSLSDGEQRAGIVLKAKPACRISGKIEDEDGDVPKDVGTLNVLAWFKRDDGKTYEMQQTGVKGDGSYLIDGLSNKPAYVMAINWRAAKQGRAYPPMYYPGTFSRNDATLIAFDKSPLAENINIKLRKEGGLAVEGTVRDEAGKPVPEAFVVVDRPDMLFDFNTTYTDEQGHYQIQGLGDGQFTIHVDAVHLGLVRVRHGITLDNAQKTTQHDVTLSRGVLISGKLVDEQGNDWPIGESYGEAFVRKEPPAEENTDFFSLTDFRNKHRPQSSERGSGGTFMLGEGDYSRGEMLFPTESTFVIQGMTPGHTHIIFRPAKEGQKVVKIMHDGQDIMATPEDELRSGGVDTTPGQELKDVTIVIGKK